MSCIVLPACDSININAKTEQYFLWHGCSHTISCSARILSWCVKDVPLVSPVVVAGVCSYIQSLPLWDKQHVPHMVNTTGPNHVLMQVFHTKISGLS